MLRWAVVFFVIALVSAFFGFSGVSAAATDIAKLFFYAFVVLFAIAAILGLVSGKKVADQIAP